ncbi:hypothetical protein C8Q72DRAFT_652925 [Fomitopsis betulina]|nr:hypothetical protein C8Q72DRAFT_652925 [Fomitopsis betulina]
MRVWQSALQEVGCSSCLRGGAYSTRRASCVDGGVNSRRRRLRAESAMGCCSMEGLGPAPRRGMRRWTAVDPQILSARAASLAPSPLATETRTKGPQRHRASHLPWMAPSGWPLPITAPVPAHPICPGWHPVDGLCPLRPPFPRSALPSPPFSEARRNFADGGLHAGDSPAFAREGRRDPGSPSPDFAPRPVTSVRQKGPPHDACCPAPVSGVSTVDMLARREGPFPPLCPSCPTAASRPDHPLSPQLPRVRSHESSCLHNPSVPYLDS